MLKFRVPTLEELPEAVRSFYKEDTGEYVLDVDGLEDTGALKRANDHIKRERDDAKRERDRLKAEKEAADLEVIKKSGDVEALTKSYEEKLAATQAAERSRVKAYEDRVKQSAIDAEATKLAAAISTVPALMKRVITDRLYVDLVDDVPIVRVFDGNGKPSALNTDDLRKELLANKDFASVLIGSKASGGGAGQGGTSGGTSGSAGSKRIAEMTADERKAFYVANPQAFIAQRDAEKRNPPVKASST